MSNDSLGDADNKGNGGNKDPDPANHAEPLVVTIEPQTKNKTSYAAKTYRLERARYRLEKKAYCVGKWTMIFLVAYTGLTFVIAASSVIATYFNKRSADAAADAATTARKTLVMNNRPWIKDIAQVTKPLTFGGKVTEMEIKHNWVNTGHSPALHLKERSKLVIISMTKDVDGELSEEQKKLCNILRETKSTLEEVVVFPNDVIPYSDGLSLTEQEISVGLKNRESGIFSHKGFISLGVVTCIDYQMEFSSEHLQTGYKYLLGVPLSWGGIMGDLKPSGTRPDVRLTYLSQSAD